MVTTQAKKRKPRRAFGAVRTLPSGSIQATYRHLGRQYAKTYPPGTRAKIIEDYLAVVRSDIATGRWVDPNAAAEAAEKANVTFGEYAEKFVSNGVEWGDIAATTAANYRQLLRRHILPTFGQRPLGDIEKVEVREWHGPLKAAHPATAAGAYRLMSTIYNRAIDDEILERTPCRIKGASADPAKERPHVTPAECWDAISAIPFRSRRYKAAVMLAAWGQLRPAEVVGLKVDDIDFDRGTITIERSYTTDNDGKSHLKGPKTEAGNRTHVLPPFVLSELRFHVDNYLIGDESGWLFPSERRESSLPVKIHRLSTVWLRARRDAGIDKEVTLRDLRGSGLTWVGQIGGTERERMRRGGHKSAPAARRYQHADDERDAEIAEALDQQWRKAGPNLRVVGE
jgi:integrase